MVKKLEDAIDCAEDSCHADDACGLDQRLEALLVSVRDERGTDAASAVRSYAEPMLRELIAAGESQELLERWFDCLREALGFSAYRRRWGG